ncbi:MAG: hypothetical protein QG657_3564 [Acidobacteriota bacterium]|nr:hypothetical protein [Acidobacteriota bacterium]
MENKLIMSEKYFSLPPRLQLEVADFIDFLSQKYRKTRSKANQKLNKEKKRKSHFGNAKGLIIVKEDFNAPIEDFQEYM